MTPPAVYIRMDRHMRVNPQTGLLDAKQDPIDAIQLITPLGSVESSHCRTLPTHAARVSPPVIRSGWHLDAMTIDTHGRGRHRREALCNRGYVNLRARRHDGTEFGGNTNPREYVGLNLHDWRGVSNGCPTCPAMLVKAMIAILRDPAVKRHTRLHGITGEACVSLWVVDHTAAP